ncbi:fimbria/pilus chaperone family protein [Serratia marcescens]
MNMKSVVGKVSGLLSGAMLMAGLMQPAAASFQLESMGIVLDETAGRVNFTVKNTSSEPMLLATKMEDLDGKAFSKSVLVSPPISRIEAGQSQQVNFVLKQGTVLPHEVMLKASFEGVGQAKDNTARIPIRQSIGLIIQPKAVSVSKTPWDDLSLSMDGDHLVMKNTGLHVIRLAPQLELQPTQKVIPLETYYLMSGEERKVKVSGKPTAVKITPLSRYGFKQGEATLPVK